MVVTTHSAAYDEFRRAKKGKKGEEYVGFFKTLKKAKAAKEGAFTEEQAISLVEQLRKEGMLKPIKKMGRVFPAALSRP